MRLFPRRKPKGYEPGMKPAYTSKGLSEGVVFPDTSQFSGEDVADMIRSGQQSQQYQRLIAQLRGLELADEAKRREHDRHLAEDDEIPL